MDIVHKAEGDAIMGACFEVYREMGCGFTERKVIHRFGRFSQITGHVRIFLSAKICEICG
jgi:hypothetical protein